MASRAAQLLCLVLCFSLLTSGMAAAAVATDTEQVTGASVDFAGRKLLAGGQNDPCNVDEDCGIFLNIQLLCLGHVCLLPCQKGENCQSLNLGK